MNNPASTPTSERVSLQLDVVEGLHAGVSLPLEDGDYAIGSKPTADIVLRDEGVEAQHVIICIDDTHVRAEAIGGAIRVDGQEIQHGQGYRLRLPAVLTVGAASLRLCRPDGKPAEIISKHYIGRYGFIAASAAGCAAIGLLFWMDLNALSSGTPPSQLVMTPRVFDEPATNGDNPSALKQVDVAAAADELRERMKNVGLRGLSVAVDGGRITLSGALLEQDRIKLTELQRWFDDRYAPDVILTANVTRRALLTQPFVQLQAIWYGEKPYIIAGDGVRYYEGAVLNSGWLVKEIGETQIVLKRDDELVSITYE